MRFYGFAKTYVLRRNRLLRNPSTGAKRSSKRASRQSHEPNARLGDRPWAPSRLFTRTPLSIRFCSYESACKVDTKTTDSRRLRRRPTDLGASAPGSNKKKGNSYRGDPRKRSPVERRSPRNSPSRTPASPRLFWAVATSPSRRRRRSTDRRWRRSTPPRTRAKRSSRPTRRRRGSVSPSRARVRGRRKTAPAEGSSKTWEALGGFAGCLIYIGFAREV